MRNELKRIGNLFRRRSHRKRSSVQASYSEGDYLDAYKRHTDLRVGEDPRAAIGGMWEEIGQLQFDYMQRAGMRPHHSLLDIGCGTLRGGRLFIRLLESGNYTGIDLSEKAIEFASQLVHDEGLDDKVPRLLVNTSNDLKLADFSDAEFDYVLAQSVFTHLKPEHIEECFAHVGRVMKPEASFHFTYFDAPSFVQKTQKDFAYPFRFFQDLAERHGLAVKDRSHDYNHPRGQRMVRLTQD